MSWCFSGQMLRKGAFQREPALDCIRYYQSDPTAALSLLHFYQQRMKVPLSLNICWRGIIEHLHFVSVEGALVQHLGSDFNASWPRPFHLLLFPSLPVRKVQDWGPRSQGKGLQHSPSLPDSQLALNPIHLHVKTPALTQAEVLVKTLVIVISGGCLITKRSSLMEDSPKSRKEKATLLLSWWNVGTTVFPLG